MKKCKKNTETGITLIGLIVTVVVLLILAGVSISTLTGENGIITKAEDAAQKYSEAQQKEIELLDEVSNFIDYMQNGSYLDLWSGKITGQNGVLTLPISMNDCSKKYIVSIESDLYKGDVLFNVYGFTDGVYMAYSAVDGNATYAAELRQFLTIEESEESLLDSIEGVLITYGGNSETCTFTYDATALGSELTITKISSVTKTYTGFAKILNKGLNEVLKISQDANNGMYDHYTEEDYLTTDFFMQFITTDSLMDCVKYCLENGVTGYEFWNEEVCESINLISEAKANPTIELQYLRDILSSRTSDVDTLRLTIIQQIQCLMVYNYANVATIYSEFGNVKDPYTFMDFWEENKYLNETYMRLIGNTFIPYTLLFSEEIITYLNEDGTLEDFFGSSGGSVSSTIWGITINSNATVYSLAFPNGYMGYIPRIFTDMYDSVFDLTINVDPSTLSELELLKIEETYHFFSFGSEVYLDIPFALIEAYSIGWLKAYDIYESTNMDYLYTMMYDNNIPVNLAGLRIGWNYVIQPVLWKSILKPEDETTLKYFFDIRRDTEYVQKAGVTSIVDDIYSYIDSVIDSVVVTQSTTEE